MREKNGRFKVEGLIGPNHPSWKSGLRKNKGYIYKYKPNHPNVKNHYVRRSHLVMEKSLKRYLERKEVVHHINGIRDDDRIENLKLFKSNSEHMKKEHGKPWNKEIKTGIIPKTAWKKGQHISPKTEIKKGQHISRKTEFKKGHNFHKLHPEWYVKKSSQ